MQLLIAGFGFLGEKVSYYFDPEDFVGISRSNEKPNVIPIDLRNPRKLNSDTYEQIAKTTLVLFSLAPARNEERDPRAYRQTYVQAQRNLSQLLKEAAAPVEKWVQISSTGVYPPSRKLLGEYDAVSNDEPDSRQSILLEAELEAFRCAETLDAEATVLRLGGIYHPRERANFLESLRTGQRPMTLKPYYTNRIHVDDAAAFTAKVLLHSLPDFFYNVVDSCPAPINEVIEFCCQHYGWPLPSARKAMPHSGKRVDNSRMLSTGFFLKYPSYREGYSD